MWEALRFSIKMVFYYPLQSRFSESISSSRDGESFVRNLSFSLYLWWLEYSGYFCGGWSCGLSHVSFVCFCSVLYFIICGVKTFPTTSIRFVMTAIWMENYAQKRKMNINGHCRRHQPPFLSSFVVMWWRIGESITDKLIYHAAAHNKILLV